MIIWNRIRINTKQIFAIVEKDLKGTLRYKFPLIISYINPFIQLIIPLILMNLIFSFQGSYGPWNAQNYVIYLFIGYIIMLNMSITNLGGRFKTEKYWRTLQALMVAPFHRYNLLIAMIVTHIIVVSIPFIGLIIIIYILYPISIFTFLFILILFVAVLLIFAGIGFFIGVFAISKEGFNTWLSTMLKYVFLFACITFPYQIFPNYIQVFVNFNPIYYIVDIIRLSWLEDNIVYTVVTHPYHMIILICLLISFPYIGLSMFNYIFKKYGIEGY